MTPAGLRAATLSRIAAAAGLLAVCGAASAQDHNPVRYTAARRHDVRRTVQLPGTVESRISSVVASEVAGLVVAVEVDEGDRVRAGQPMVRLRPRYYELQLREAQGRFQEAQARLALAESKLARARELFADEVISQQDLDDAVSEFTAWQGRDAQSRAEIEQLEFSLDRLVIRAPFTGVVVRKRVELGEWLDLGGDVMDLVALAELDVRVDVPERYFDDLAPGGEATVRFEAIPELALGGRLAAIVPRADPQARTFPIKVRIANPDGRIGVGMLAAVDLPVGRSYVALIVPKDAVIRQEGRPTVFRIDDRNAVESLAVDTGPGIGSWVVVDGPLQPGDRVVTRGNERLRPGQTVDGQALEYPLP